MSDSSIGSFFEDVFEQGGKITNQVGKQMNITPGSVAKKLGNQVMPGLTPKSTPGTDKTEESPDNKKGQKQSNPITPPKNTNQILKGQFIKPKPEEIIKEQQSLQKVRQELHQNYYQGLVNRPKPKEEPVAEKLQREEKAGVS